MPDAGRPPVSSSPISAVVFDVGNVLYDWHPRFLYEKLIDDPGELRRVIEIVMSDRWHWQLDAGRTFAEIEPQLIEQFPKDARYIRAWGARFQESIGPQIEGMGAIVDALAAADVPIFGITNFPGEFWIPFRAREAALFDRFADIVVSGLEGIAKPDPAIYQLAQDRFGRAANSMIFIDDLHQNVAAAEAAGFVGHQFRNAPALRAVLREIGLVPA